MFFMIKIKLKSFGIFGNFFGEDYFLYLDDNLNLGLLRGIIILKLHESNFNVNNFKDLIRVSIFSNKNEILNDDYILKNNDVIYLLPPVSGG